MMCSPGFGVVLYKYFMDFYLPQRHRGHRERILCVKPYVGTNKFAPTLFAHQHATQSFLCALCASVVNKFSLKTIAPTITLTTPVNPRQNNTEYQATDSDSTTDHKPFLHDITT